MQIKVSGVKETQKALQEIIANLKDAELVTRPLAQLMRSYVHVDSGHLRSTIYHDGPVAGASADYAGFEAERGGSHDYAGLAVNYFNIEAYANEIVRPF